MSDLSFSEVGEILHLLQEVDCSEIDLEWGELKVQVRKAGALPQATPTQEVSASTTLAAKGTALEAVGNPAPPAPEAAQEPLGASASEEVPSSWSSVDAPMAGTFYRSPSAGEPAFVEVGGHVEPGDTVALIEVMKLFTELKAEVSGTVARIDVPDSTLVEFGQSLVWIEPV